MHSHPNPVLNCAILVSLALHALLLFTFQNPPDPARRAARLPSPIVARLAEPEPAAVPLPAPAPAPEPVQQAAAPRPKKPAAPIAQPAAEAALTPAPQAPPQPAPQTEAVPPETARAPAPVAIGKPAAVPAAPNAEAPDPVSRDRYRVELIDEARRHKRYPPLARENNWEGGVLVGVVIGANGRASVTLKASSGYEVLDRQALEMFSQAARAVPVPPALRGKEFALEVRAVYGLED